MGQVLNPFVLIQSCMRYLLDHLYLLMVKEDLFFKNCLPNLHSLLLLKYRIQDVFLFPIFVVLVGHDDKHWLMPFNLNLNL